MSGQGIEIRHARSNEELSACYPVIAQLRPALRTPEHWCNVASAMAVEGYRVLVAERDGLVVAIAGYRLMRNLIHGRFLYVDDLVTTGSERGRGVGAMMLDELYAIGRASECDRLVLDTAAANADARRFYVRCGMMEVVAGFVRPIESPA